MDVDVARPGQTVDPAPYRVGTDCPQEVLLAAVKVYARAVVDRHGLNANVSDLDWRLSTRAKRRAGAVEYRNGQPLAVTLALQQFRNQGWSATAATVRHELAHVHLLRTNDDPSHGEAFRRLAAALETHRNCDRFVPPEWWVTCQDCGNRLARYRRSKLVQQPGKYRCGACGGRLVASRNEPATD